METRNDDWRLQGQEKYLLGAKLSYGRYRSVRDNPAWDHDHCEFCFATFTVDDVAGALHEGYHTLDDYRWICSGCFTDFRERFAWELVS